MRRLLPSDQKCQARIASGYRPGRGSLRQFRLCRRPAGVGGLCSAHAKIASEGRFVNRRTDGVH